MVVRFVFFVMVYLERLMLFVYCKKLILKIFENVMVGCDNKFFMLFW